MNFWKCFIEWQNVVRLCPCCAAPDVEVNPPDLVTPLLRNPSVCGLSYISWVSPANGAQITDVKFSFSLTVCIIFLLYSYCSRMCLKGLNLTSAFWMTMWQQLKMTFLFGNSPDAYLICLNSHVSELVWFLTWHSLCTIKNLLKWINWWIKIQNTLKWANL